MYSARNRVQRQHMRYAECKPHEAQLRFARTERSILHWSRILADLKYERTCAIQPPHGRKKKRKMRAELTAALFASDEFCAGRMCPDGGMIAKKC